MRDHLRQHRYSANAGRPQARRPFLYLMAYLEKAANSCGVVIIGSVTKPGERRQKIYFQRLEAFISYDCDLSTALPPGVPTGAVIHSGVGIETDFRQATFAHGRNVNQVELLFEPV